MSLVAVSAAYGARGSQITPALADRLGEPFLDRALAMRVAERLGVSVQDALTHETPVSGPSLLERLLAGFQGADSWTAPAPMAPSMASEQDFHRVTREELLAQVATGSGVILGRGAVAALREDRRVLRVRLTGPVDARIEQAMTLGHVDRAVAERALRRLDRAHASYLRRFYDVDINDPGLYHLILDATALSTDVCVDLISRAVDGLSASAVS